MLRLRPGMSSERDVLWFKFGLVMCARDGFGGSQLSEIEFVLFLF